ncbi:MAG: bifunctional precorrin-2 dehydrogenase/sirohydrochlorin ferrochelatase [Actinobacteria bacterium]|nr:MAG: bifunctional precorrin-2 dehydrogenase/sirohydrochlorin ferrochelatase [Actinomycetota bacterium]
MTTGYPAILMLDGRLGVVIGGGAVGERKVRTLLEAGARVKVITPEATPRLQKLAEQDRIELHVRSYERGDLKGAAVVIASTDERDVNQAIYEEALDEGIPVNVVDDPPHCTFIAPSIIRRGDLMIAISTGGTNPAMAVRIRERLEKEFGPEYEVYFDLIKRLKAEVDQAPTQQERADAWYRVADSNVLDLVRAGRIDKAFARAVEMLGAR